MLDNIQLEAVSAGNGPVLVTACPGSGKTTVLISRIQYLIHEMHIQPDEILVITFTKEAALSMERRFKRVEPLIGSVHFGTIHSVFFHILSIEKGYRGSDIIYGKRKARLLRAALKENGEEKEFFPEFYDILSGQLLNFKIGGEAESRFDLEKVSRSYDLLKEKYHLIDFDDMIIKSMALLEENPKIRKKWSDRFSHILVDEAQDLSRMQFDAIKLLAGEKKNVFLVGDEDQSIYSFRHADPSIMLEFKENMGGASIYKLTRNYRCQEGIVQAASKLISNNKNRFDKIMTAASDRKSEIIVRNFKNTEEESEFVSESIINDIRSGMKPSSIAVLYRTNIRKDRLLIKLVEKKILVSIKAEPEKQNEVNTDIISFFRILSGKYKRCDLFRLFHFMRLDDLRDIFYEENMSIEDALLEKGLLEDDRSRLKNLSLKLKTASSLSPFARIKFLMNSFKYREYLEEAGKDSESLKNYYFDLLNEALEKARTIRSSSRFLSVLENDGTFLEKSDENGVKFYTFHGSKGLEFEKVYILDACQGITPSEKAVSNNDIEEERRMFYVAVTRAKKSLFIGTTALIGEREMKPSIFIEEMGIL